MKQVISYSLYGSEMRFLVGAIKNAELAQRFFPGFTCRYYYGKSVPKWVLSTLLVFPHVELIKVEDEENSIARTWRFMACLDTDVDVVLSRDVDARLSIREAEAHQEFMDSEFNFHIIRDHPAGHNYVISAGMFAMKTQAYGNLMHKKLLDYDFRDEYMADQNFLAREIYPHVKNDCLVHDEYYNIKTKPPSEVRWIKRKRLSTLCHIGCAVDENDVYVYYSDRDMAIQETGHVTYMYDWGNDERTNNRQ
jgi:protein O-GlcNAc transferase